MTRLPKPLARRIDRASRAAHFFHRWAHHPLCVAYAGEVFRFGALRLCRGCSLAVLGAATGFAVSLAWRPSDVAAWLVAVAAVVLVVSSRLTRLPKVLGRFAPASAVGLLPWLAPPALFAAAGALAWYVSYRRRGPERSPCRNCPHLTESPCPGFTRIVQRERAFRRLSGRWLDAALR